MQSAQNDASNCNLIPGSPETSSSYNHGFLPHQPQPTELSRRVDRDSSTSDNSSITSSSGSSRGQRHLRRLSLSTGTEKARPKPSHRQISEYEKASSPASRKSWESPTFQVVLTKGNISDNGQKLDKFPNEILTHIFSHLPAASLTSVSLVSWRFYTLVTTPHAWRSAFSRFFPGQDADTLASPSSQISDQSEQFREQRFFTRLTGLASWRSEYILRTKLLRSLARGKPASLSSGLGASPRANTAANNSSAIVTYSSQIFAVVNHIHGIYDNGRKSPQFVHGAEDVSLACSSDPSQGKVNGWGLSDPQALPQFADLFPGTLPYGLDNDGPTGIPNVMSLSQPFGMIHGEGFPGGSAYFRSADEMRGRFLAQPTNFSDLESGIPLFPAQTEAISAVWIAKSISVPVSTKGLVGIMTGSTLGVITAYSLGADALHLREVRSIRKGQVTARWVLCPGVPIISIVIDDSYNAPRKNSGRVWATALNALGEVYYLTETPTSALLDTKVEGRELERQSWLAGRTVLWHLVEGSRRVAREDPYEEAEIHGSYSPRSSSISLNLSEAQTVAETREIEKFLRFKPSHFRKFYQGWDMQRRLEVDFGGDDETGAGESVFVIKCGIAEGENAEIMRFTRWRSEQGSLDEYPLPKTPPMAPKSTAMASLFGDGSVVSPLRIASPEPKHSPVMSSSVSVKLASFTPIFEEWRSSLLSLKDHPDLEITCSAVDESKYAILTRDEDPLEKVNGNTGIRNPVDMLDDSTGSAHIPGHRARYLAVGTKTGSVIMYNMRGPQSANPALCNELQPLRTIATDSPQITCLAISALHVIVGGNDGLVQLWDPLASTSLPVRTLHSRFSSRARQRLVQAAASVHGVGINLYAAGAISIDPDPTMLRGMVSLGTHLRYWSYSSSASDQYQSKKRRIRRSNERGNNGSADKFIARSSLKGYIATEQEELRKEKARRAREQARLIERFGVGLADLTEEEALQYAEMVSAETFRQQEERRVSDAGYFADAGDNSSTQSQSDGTVTPEGSIKSQKSTTPLAYDQYDYDLEEAIRLSMLDGVDDGGRSPKASGCGEYDIPITYKMKKSGRRSASSSPSSSKTSMRRTRMPDSRTDADLASDLELALQLSLVEQQSMVQVNRSEEDFPSLGEVSKGKGKSRAI